MVVLHCALVLMCSYLDYSSNPVQQPLWHYLKGPVFGPPASLGDLKCSRYLVFTICLYSQGLEGTAGLSVLRGMHIYLGRQKRSRPFVIHAR
jgi:hypothetical protein